MDIQRGYEPGGGWFRFPRRNLGRGRLVALALIGGSAIFLAGPLASLVRAAERGDGASIALASLFALPFAAAGALPLGLGLLGLPEA